MWCSVTPVQSAISVLAVLCSMSLLEAGEPGYGTLRGQFVLEGEAPTPKILVRKEDPRAKDAAVCAACEIRSESLLVDPKSRGIANIFIFKQTADAVHPELRESPKETLIEAQGCRFIPHALLLRTDQTIRFRNRDPIPHSVHTFLIENEQAGFIQPHGNSHGVTYQFPKPEKIPLPVRCDIHAHMTAYWLILDHPYAAVTCKEGTFRIEKLPAGNHEFRVWHEAAGWLDKKLEIEIQPERTTTLPVVKVPAERFAAMRP